MRGQYGKRETLLTIRRGDIWLVNLDPTVGAEIRKTRPVVVLSSDAIGALPVKLVAPITEWKEHLARNVWHVTIDPDQANGLAKKSVVDALQLRGVDQNRFVKRLGVVSPGALQSILIAVTAVIEYE